MEDLRTLVIGVIGGLLVIVISKLYKAFRKKNLREDIEFIEYEKKHLAEMKRSSVEMNRSSFRAIFAVLMFVGIANLIPSIQSFFLGGILQKTGNLLGFLSWTMVVVLSLNFWRRYDKLKNFKEATEKMNDKLEKLKTRLDQS